jgi:hypothetical protein
MIWFFERERKRLQWEIRTQSDGPGVELAITFPDGSQYVEHFASTQELVERSGRLTSRLQTEGWRPLGDWPAHP